MFIQRFWLAFVALAGCVAARPVPPASASAACPPPARPAPVATPTVARSPPRLVLVARETVVRALEFSATLVPAVSASVVAHTSGVARTLHVDVGAQVHRGEVMAVVGPANDAPGRLESVRAPIDGFVLERLQPLAAPVVGDRTVLFTVADIERLTARAEARAPDALMLRAGLPAELRVPSMPDRTFQTAISRIDPTVTPGQMVLFELPVANPDHALRVGSIVQVSVVVERIEDALTVPQDAVVIDEEGTHVFVVDVGSAHARRVVPRLRQRDRVEIVEGLHEGERVLTPAARVHEGDSVDATE